MRDLGSPTGMEPVAPAVEVRRPNHWTTREVPLGILIVIITSNLFLSQKRHLLSIEEKKRKQFCKRKMR